MPGVAPDARGVVLGEKGLVLFASLDRLVAFLRAYSHEGSLDELLSGLSIEQLITPLKTRELLLRVDADSSYRMDRIAGLAKLTGGLVFTGSSHHFVRYRDAAAPLGYDVEALSDAPGELHLYDLTFAQTYELERSLDLRAIVLQLDLLHRGFKAPGPSGPTPSSELYVTAEQGVAHALIGYLFRWRVRGEVGLAELPPQSAFDDRGIRLHLVHLHDAPSRIVVLLSDLPGVRVFRLAASGVAVELGYEHPIDLASCSALFPKDELVLIHARSNRKDTPSIGHDGVLRLEPLPPLAKLETLVRSGPSRRPSANAASSTNAASSMDAASPTTARLAPAGQSLEIRLPLRLARSSRLPRRVVATIVSSAERAWLAQLLYRLPPSTLAELEVASSDELLVLKDRRGIEGLPLGRFLREMADNVFIPAGMELLPPLDGERLRERLEASRDDCVLLLPAPTDGSSADDADEASALQALSIPLTAFQPISHALVEKLDTRPISIDAPEGDHTPLPHFHYGDARRFPLWGVHEED